MFGGCRGFVLPFSVGCGGGLAGPGAVCPSESRGCKGSAGEPKMRPQSQGWVNLSGIGSWQWVRVWSCQRWAGDRRRAGKGSRSCRAAPVPQGLSQTQQKGEILVRALQSPRARGASGGRAAEPVLLEPSFLQGLCASSSASPASPGVSSPNLCTQRCSLLKDFTNSLLPPGSCSQTFPCSRSCRP